MAHSARILALFQKIEAADAAHFARLRGRAKHRRSRCDAKQEAGEPPGRSSGPNALCQAKETAAQEIAARRGDMMPNRMSPQRRRSAPKNALAALRPPDWTPRLCDDYTTCPMSIAKRPNKPQNHAVPRRLSSTLRAARVTRALSLSDLVWRALQAGRRRKRRAA